MNDELDFNTQAKRLGFRKEVWNAIFQDDSYIEIPVKPCNESEEADYNKLNRLILSVLGALVFASDYCKDHVYNITSPSYRINLNFYRGKEDTEYFCTDIRYLKETFTDDLFRKQILLNIERVETDYYTFLNYRLRNPIYSRTLYHLCHTIKHHSRTKKNYNDLKFLLDNYKGDLIITGNIDNKDTINEIIEINTLFNNKYLEIKDKLEDEIIQYQLNRFKPVLEDKEIREYLKSISISYNPSGDDNESLDGDYNLYNKLLKAYGFNE